MLIKLKKLNFVRKYFKTWLIGLILFFFSSLASAINSNSQVILESNTESILNDIKHNAIMSRIKEYNLGEIIKWVALQMLGQPYRAKLLDKSLHPGLEYLYVSLSSTDCMLFVEHVMALSILIKTNHLTLYNLINQVQKERYHGTLSYCNRNHYFKDWALANQANGFVIDEAFKLNGKTLPYTAHILSDKISSNPNDFHKAYLLCIKEREKLIDKQQVGFIPLKELTKYLPLIRNGDIIGIVRTPTANSDSIQHVGIAYRQGNEVGMIHASSKFLKVIIDNSLINYLKKSPASLGIILLRPQLNTLPKRNPY
jgi:hypothetical protein